MQKIYLYLKTHRQTGLKYLGKTVQDPYEYRGSGTRWRRHLNKHGNDVDTKVLFESTDPLKIKQQGLYYSQLWNVVDDQTFANCRPESGDGGDTSQCNAYKEGMAKRDLTGKLNPMYGRSAVAEQNLKWYTNGKETIYVSEGTQPAGFTPGRNIKSRKSPTKLTKQKISESLSRPCISPDGTIYKSRNAAAKALGITPEALGGRIKRGVSGWKYLD